MMRAMRDKKTMHVILWTLVAAFVGWLFIGFGMKYTGAARHDPSIIAKVGNIEITREEFNQVYQPTLEKLESVDPEGPTTEETKQLEGDILNELIDNKIILLTASRMGISVTDEELAANIRRNFVDENGTFSKERYDQYLQKIRMTDDQFVESQRQELLQKKIRSLLADGILWTNGDIEEFAALLNRDMKADYVVLDEPGFEKSVKVKDDELKDYYESNISQYDHPDRVKARHIIIFPSQAEGFQDPDKIKKTLEDFRQQILSGKAKFQDLAAKFSQDEGSKNNGGEIGWVSRDLRPELKELGDQAFSLKKGEISKPFKLQNGYDILQVEETQKAYQSTFSGVKDKVLEQCRREKATQKIIALTENLTAKLSNQEPLQQAAKELGLTVGSTDWFNSKSGVPHLGVPKDAVEELATLYPKDWKGPISTHQKVYFFEMTDAREGKKTAPMTDRERLELIKRLNQEKQQSWLKDFLSSQRKKLGVKTFLEG